MVDRKITALTAGATELVERKKHKPTPEVDTRSKKKKRKYLFKGKKTELSFIT